jgi:hypothetical protein
MSHMTDAFYDEGQDGSRRFLKIYNMQGHYSSSQSVYAVFGPCCQLRIARKTVRVIAYAVSAVIFVCIYLSIVDAFAMPMPSYQNVDVDN